MPMPTTATRRQPRPRLDAVDLAARDLVAELLGQPIARAPGRPFGDGEADRLLGRRLRDERDADPLLVQRLERPRRDPRHAQHAVARDGEQRLAAHRRERLDRVAIERAARGDLRAGGGGVGERADEHRDRAAGHRDERPRVQHLGAEVGQLGRLADVQLRDHARVGHDARIGGEQARDVLPERDLLGRQRASEQRGGQIGAAPPERRHAGRAPIVRVVVRGRRPCRRSWRRR